MLKKIFLHIVIITTVAVIILFTVISMLHRYTRHDEVYVMPDFIGMDHQEVMEEYGDLFRFIISDSIYDKRLDYGSVLQQDPLPDSKVKRNRNIYLVTVARLPEKVIMPNLSNLSVRQAIVSLETAGLEVGDISFTEHFAKNAVVKQLYLGENCKAGTELYRGSRINLILGNGGEHPMVRFPQIYGKDRKEARLSLQTATLNIKNEHFMDNQDTAHSRVYKVEPYFAPGNELRAGTAISIWYRSIEKVDFDKFINDSLYIEEPKEENIFTDDID